MAWNLSCPDWEQRLRTGRSLVPDLPLDLVAGNRAVAVFDRLKLADVPGTPRLGPVLDSDPEEQQGNAAGDWFRDIVRALAGSWDPVQRQRFIREVFCLVPKKNSKTSYAALLMLTFLLLNQRPRAPFILFAPVQDTAELAFSQAAGAIALDPVLDKKLHVRDHLKTIVHRETKAELEIMTFDPAVVTGKKPVGTLLDEVHVIAKNGKAASALRQIRGGMLPFPEAFMVQITTQSEEAPVGIFASELAKARDVRDGLLDAPILPVLYEFSREMQQHRDKPWRDPANWHMVTPNAGRSITVERLVEECEIAERTSDAELRAWASQHLNIEIGLALRSDGWSGAEFWEQAPKAVLTIEELIARCDVITIGIDGGGLDDMLGFWALGRARLGGDWLSWAHAWIHPIALERRKSEASRYQDFAAAGDLTIVEKIGDDVNQVADIVEQIHDAGRLPEKGIGVDPVGIGAIVDALEERGIDQETYIVGVPQGWKLSGAIKTTERRLAEGTLHHSHAPLLAWCVGNCRVEPRGNAITITKQAAGFAKIDPVMALFNAVTLMTLVPEPDVIHADYELMTV
ncbi:MAG: terminase large subunit [Burkholderiales bacterium]|nr:MAG: terminase large subunit [Burkholderiales bacterium]